MLMLVIYSFNSSKLVTVWAGWSTRWYGELLRDDAMMSAVGLSLTIAACAAHGGGDPRDYCGGGAGALWQVSRIKWLCLYDHRAAGDARCHHGLVAVVIIRRACSCHWLACGPRYAHHLAGACHFLYGLCGGRYFFQDCGNWIAR
ncbi:putrescine ABC transporter membrane protein [Escherichia coli]|uniref:Putrescine ABC transporter membrane protein n=1 Tax=Escherichia coli TaxID=562 RepID=A0A376KZ99_ECOLX|nr:putrescine ABC transporter membrane protein [Escherichia coli]